MTIVMYDLVGRDDRRFSPWCWATRMAIAHKGLECETRPTRFTGIQAIQDGQYKTIPVIEDGATVVSDSFQIAEYLDANYSDATLFDGKDGKSGAQFFKMWFGTSIVPQVAQLILVDVYNNLQPEDQPYFRQAREERFGKPLEQVQAGREERLDAFRAALTPARLIVRSQDFLGGDAPAYIDYQLFGGLQWARVMSEFRLLEDDDPVMAWFGRCLDLYGGLGRSQSGYWG